MRHPKVLIADDEAEFRNAFVSKHAASGFSVEQMTDVYSLPQNLKEASSLPDLVVLDLYRTLALPDTQEADKANAEVNKLLAELDDKTAELKAVVDRVKKPAAIKVLREIRSIPRLSDIPVLIYTRQGLSLLSDEEIREAIGLGADWMLKGRSPDVERAQMHSFLRNAELKRRRIKRDVMLTVLGAMLGTILGVIVQSLVL